MKIRFANTARISLHAAINFIHQDNPLAAANFLIRVEKTLRRLEKYPESGRRIPEYPELPYRELLVLPYRFFFSRRREDYIHCCCMAHSADADRSKEIEGRLTG